MSFDLNALFKILLGGWDPIYQFVVPSSRQIPFLLLLSALPFFWWLLGRWQYIAISPRSLFWKTFLLVFVFQWLVQALPECSAHSIIRHGNANSFYTVAKNVPIKAYLKDYLSLRSTLPLHATANMPGKVLLYYLFLQFMDSAELFAAVIIVLSNLGGVFIYLITAKLTQNKTTAYLSALFYWLLPAKLEFFPLLNTVTPTLILFNFWIFLEALKGLRAKDILSCGISLFVLFLFEPLPLICGIFHVVFLLGALIQKQKSIPQLMLLITGVIGTFFAVHLLFFALTGFDSLTVFLELVRVNHRYYETYVAPFWFLRNLGDLAIGLGYGSLCLLVGGAFLGKSLFSRSTRFSIHSVSPICLYGLGLILSVGLLNLSGSIRAEIPRLWLFMMAFFPTILAVLLTRFHRGLRYVRPVLFINIVQTIFSLHYIRFIWWPV